MANAIEQIYNQLAEVFGGTNPNQVFSMVMPGTQVDSSLYAYDTTHMKPSTVQEAESKLVDQMFDIAKVSGSSNGQRVSSQYLQALSVLIPKFNPQMPVLKKTLRDFLNRPVPDNTMLDGNPFTGTMQAYYFSLYDQYIAVKLDWERQIVAKKTELAANPDTANELFLEWYEQIAEGELAKVDQALAKVLGVFSPSDMNAILGALASGPGGELNEATNIVKDIQLASPNGGFFYPVDLSPANWFLNLASDMDPVNLLKDPAFIADALSAKRKAVMSSIFQIQSMLNTMTTEGDIKAAADDLKTKQQAYTDAQNKLLNTYSDNTALAVKIYLAKYGSEVDQALADEEAAKNELDAITDEVSESKGEPSSDGAEKKDGSPFLAEDVDEIVSGQKDLIKAQSDLQISSQAVADAGLNLASAQSSNFGNLPLLLSRMQAQLAEIENLQSNLAASISNGGTNSNAQITAANNALKVAQAAEAESSATADTVANSINSITGLPASVSSAADTAKAATGAGAASVLAAIKNAVTPILLNRATDTIPKIHPTAGVEAAKAALEAAQKEAAKSSATAATVASSIGTSTDLPTSVLGAATAAAAADGATPKSVLTAIKNAANAIIPTTQKSETSPGFMELQMSFSSSEMTTSSSTDTSFSQTSWGVDLFFGSASGSSSSSSSVTAKNSFDSSTEIKIGLKAAKVDIRRGWFNPGVFKLSKDMNRISSDFVSGGAMTTKSDGTIDWTPSKIENLNSGLLPSFPVSFLVVKDVNITFQANESSLDAIHSVLDSKSAVGGGFLCFSASSSSASHSDHSSMSTKTKSNVVNISLPAPQILGWYLEMTPADGSTPLTDADSATGQDINIIEFINQVSALDEKEDNSSDESNSDSNPS